MTHSILNTELDTELVIDETSGKNTCISIIDGNVSLYHYLTPEQLHSFIGALLHVQAKKKSEIDNIRNRYSIKHNS